LSQSKSSSSSQNQSSSPPSSVTSQSVTSSSSVGPTTSSESSSSCMYLQIWILAAKLPYHILTVSQLRPSASPVQVYHPHRALARSHVSLLTPRPVNFWTVGQRMLIRGF
jgi:hypothetical protein